MVRILLLLAFAGAITACDSGSEPGPGTVSVRDSLGSVGLYLGTDTTFSLSSRFETTALPLTYTAVSDAPSVVQASASAAYGGTLHLHLAAAGEATVRVVARAPDGGEAMMAFPVYTRDECPPGPAEGQGDFFPIRSGQIWRYMYNRSLTGVGVGGTDTETGTITYVFGNASCRRGRRTVTADVHRQTQVVQYRYMPTTSTTTFTVDRHSPMHATEDSSGLHIDDLGTTHIYLDTELVRYHPVTPETREIGYFLYLSLGRAPYRMRHFFGAASTQFEETLTLASES